MRIVLDTNVLMSAIFFGGRRIIGVQIEGYPINQMEHYE